MKQFLALLTFALAVEVALADVPPPPPPKGKKYVSVSNEVVLGKDVTGYVFVQQVAAGPGAPRISYSKLQLTPGKAAALAPGGRRTYVSLLAVPQDAAKEYKTDAELFDALKGNKVKGVQRVGFPGTATVPDSVKGDSVKWTHTITAITDKGAKVSVEGEGAKPAAGGAKNAPGGGDSPDAEDAPNDAPAAAAPRGGLWVAGVAAFAGVLLGGLWLAGRARRK